MLVIIVSMVVSFIVNIFLSKKIVDRTKQMIADSLDETMDEVEKFSIDLHAEQEEGSPRYWYTKGCKDTAVGVKDLLGKTYK